MTQEIVDKLAWLVERRTEVANLNKVIESLETEILEMAETAEVEGKLEFGYAGRSFRASINTGRISLRIDKQGYIDAIRSLLPEGKQTKEEAEKVLKNFRAEKPMKDSVTTREIKG